MLLAASRAIEVHTDRKMHDVALRNLIDLGIGCAYYSTVISALKDSDNIQVLTYILVLLKISIMKCNPTECIDMKCCFLGGYKW